MTGIAIMARHSKNQGRVENDMALLPQAMPTAAPIAVATTYIWQHSTKVSAWLKWLSVFMQASVNGM
ncbi:MAG TPA: hypothetical protein VHP58_05835 [Alphaproteobacteria bacterium]|nr:hypothetical protein [Alphaproteobacteria bacterium]